MIKAPADVLDLVSPVNPVALYVTRKAVDHGSILLRSARSPKPSSRAPIGTDSTNSTTATALTNVWTNTS